MATGDQRPERLALTLLGGFRAMVGERPIDAGAWRQRRAAAVVKLLALAPGYRLHREQLQDLLWPELDLTAANNNLRHALHVARRILLSDGPANHPWLSRQGEMLVLGEPEAIWTDVDAFETAVSQARRTRDLAANQAAVALYGGDLLADDPYADWAADRRQGLRTTYLALLREVAGLAEGQGQRGVAIDAWSRLVTHEPTDEAAQRRLIEHLAETGQRQLAARQYQHLVEVLERELGAEPEPATVQLYQALRAGRLAPATPAAPAERSVPTSERSPAVGASTNLPLPLTSFVGREQARAMVAALLGEARLLTLTGAGGAGKTRLAQAVGWAVLDRYRDGVWLASLAALTDPALVLVTIAGALGVHEQPGQALLTTLLAAATGREQLLIVDNCEHLLEASARLIETLLGATRN